jgi:outer membrane receptor for monomeric catechols
MDSLDMKQRSGIFIMSLLLLKMVHIHSMEFLDMKANTASSHSFTTTRETLTEAGGAAIFKYDLSSLYIQDEIEISDKLNVLVGLRYDEFDSDDSPAVKSRFC